MAHDIDDMVAENEREDSFRGVGSAAWRKQERWRKQEQQPSDWDGALRSQQIDTMRRQEEARNAALAEQINANRGVFDGYMQIGNHMAAQKRQQVNNANAHLASALRLSAMNGGNLPQYSWGGISAALGIDPQRGAIIGGGFDSKSGKFRLQLASADRLSLIKQLQNAGQPIPDELRKPQELEFTPQQQYSLMLSSPGVFSRQEVERMRNELINTYHMHPDQVPPVPLGWGETGRVGIGNATATGGTSVNPAWLYGPQRRANISAFGSNGRGGFTNYDSNDNTGHQLQVRDSGTRAEGDNGRWKVLSSGSHGGGRRGTRYENDKTGEVVFVPEGQTIESVTRGGSEKERIARMNNETREKVQQQRGEAQRDVAHVTADATKHKADASVEVAAQNGRAKTTRGGGRSDGDSSASLRRILDKSSGATDEERRKTIAMLQAREERRDQELAMSDKDRALKRADDIIDLYGGDMSGFPIKDKEQIRKLVAGELYAGKEYDPDEWSSYFDSLRTQRAKNAQGAQKAGKAEVKTGDNGGGNGRQFKEGDVQEINRIKMKLLPSKKNPGKLTWQRV